MEVNRKHATKLNKSADKRNARLQYNDNKIGYSSQAY